MSTAWNHDIRTAPHGRYVVQQRRAGIDTKVCSIEGCNSPVRARGWCNAHWTRWHRHGDPLGGGTSPGERLRYLCEVVYPHEGEECLMWPFGLTGAGYAQAVVDGRYEYAHRLACEHKNGPAPSPKYEAAHNCGNGHIGCVNPNHLEWKTRTANRADMIGHGTHVQGERHGQAKLTDSDVRYIRSLKNVSLRQIAKAFDIHPSTARRIVLGESWKHLLHHGEQPVAWMAWPEHPNSKDAPRPSINDEPSPEAGPQAEASLAGTGSGTLAGREGRHEGEAASVGLPTIHQSDGNAVAAVTVMDRLADADSVEPSPSGPHSLLFPCSAANTAGVEPPPSASATNSNSLPAPIPTTDRLGAAPLTASSYQFRSDAGLSIVMTHQNIAGV